MQHIIISLLVIVAIVAVLLWLIYKLQPPGMMKPDTLQLLRFLAVLLVVGIAIVKVFGLLGQV